MSLKHFRLKLISAAIVAVTAPVSGGPVETEHVTIQLVSDRDSLQPGRSILVGLYFEMENEWHIYWRNPGDSGEAPRIQWNLPTGFQAGEVQWPAPARLGSGSVIDYGYQQPVLLYVEIKTPKNLAVGNKETLSADVSWLVCKDICVPGKTSLTLSLFVRTRPGPMTTSRALFQEARSRVPRPLPPAWSADALSDRDSFLLTIRGAGVGKKSFFPLEVDQVDNAAPQTTTALPDGVRLTLKKSDRLLKTPAMLNGILELGSGRAYIISALVRSP